jgi:hypothetical protein
MNRSSDDFEAAVGTTLAELARVDRSTVAETHAFIAALPDRHPGRALLRWPDRWSAGLAAAVVGLVAVAVVASALGGLNNAPAASATPSPQPTASGEPNVVPSSPPIVFATASPVVPAFNETLPVVMTGANLWMQGWSPDGSSFAIAEQPPDTPPSTRGIPVVHLFKRDMTPEGTVDASQLAWTDATHFVALRYESSSDGTAGGHVYAGRIGSVQLTQLPGNFQRLVSGPSGAVALMQWWDGTPETPTHYVVLSGGAESDARDGYPVAWSRDGSLLAIIHPTGPPPPRGVGSQVTGWIEVVGSAGQSVVKASSANTWISSEMAFTPDGSRLAFQDDTHAADGRDEIGVLTVATGQVQMLGHFGPMTWLNSYQLLYVDTWSSIPSENVKVMVWSDTDGTFSSYSTGNVLTANGWGGMVVGMNGGDVNLGTTGPTNLTLVRQNGWGIVVGTVALGNEVFGEIPGDSWSPDGQMVVLVVGDGQSPFQDAVLAQ